MIVRQKIIVLDTVAELAEQAALEFEIRARTAVQARERFAAVLSGGTTPAAMFERLASTELVDSIPWENTHLFWSDERCVPPEDPHSNYGMAERLLLSRIPIPRENIHRIKGELEPTLAAAEYRQQIAAFFGKDPVRFDLVFLGLGADGHTASLFPHSGALEARELCVANRVEGAPVSEWRITLTYTAINSARAVVFLVAGESKADVLPKVLEGPRDIVDVPAQGIAPTDGDLVWLLDRAVASKLNL